MTYIYYIDIINSTVYISKYIINMNFLALNDDVKFIIASHLASDLKIRSLLSKNHGIQKKLFNEVVTYVCAHECYTHE